MNLSSSLVRRLLAALTLITLCGFVQAQQAWPTRTVRIVHPYPGGPLDAAIRFLAERLALEWGQPVIVEAKPGGSEVIAADTVAKAAPDGHTLLIATEATFANNPYLFRTLPYDPFADLVPVSELLRITFALISRGDFPADDLKGFIEQVRKDGDRYTYGSAGIGNPLHLAMEQFMRIAGIRMLHVPYRTPPQAINDLLGGRLDASFGSVQIAAPFVPVGKMKMFAVTSSQRLKVMPGVPTFAELGLPQMSYQPFIALAVPKGTPDEIGRKVQADLRKVIADPQTAQRILDPNGYEAVTSDPETFARTLAARRVAAQELIRSLGVKLD
jgi:tripartite-type tricarboxylate transporter receptor subunit TctC